jgi:hypothetical protein
MQRNELKGGKAMAFGASSGAQVGGHSGKERAASIPDFSGHEFTGPILQGPDLKSAITISME